MKRTASLILVGLFLWSSACTKWVTLEPPYSAPQEEYDKLRVTNERGLPVELEQPRFEGDSVWGTTISSYWERGDLKHSEEVVAMPLESVQKIEKRGSDTAATAGLVVGIVGGLALIGLATGAGDMEFDPFEGYGE